MPSAVKYVPPTDRWRNSLTPTILAEKTERHKQYAEAMKYYKGKHVPQLVFDPETEPDDNVTVNLVRMAVDHTASFLFSESPVWEAVAPTAGGDAGAEKVEETDEEVFIRKFFKEAGGLAIFTKMVQRGFLGGHVFVRVKPPRAFDKYPRLILLEPTAVTVWWKADDEGEILWYEYRYTVGDQIYIQDFVADRENGRWLIYTYASKEDNDDIDIPQENQLLGIPGPHGLGFGRVRLLNQMFQERMEFKLVRPNSEADVGTDNKGRDYAIHSSDIAPIVEWPHIPDPDNYYGMSEAVELDLQDTINRIWSKINQIVREHADPIDVVLGADVQDVTPLGDDLMVVSGQGAKVQRMEMRGDLGAAVATVDKLTETFLSLVRVVILKGDAKDLQRVTNTSIRTLFIDMLAKNNLLRDTYGAGLVKIARLALMMSKKPFAGKELEVEIEWKSPLPVDLTEVANINALAINAGYRSLETAARELGDDWEVERAAMANEHDLAMQRQEEQLSMMSKFETPAPENRKKEPNQDKNPNQPDKRDT